MDSLTAFLNKRKKKTTPATNNAGSLSSLEKFLESRKNPPKPTKPALPKPTVQPVAQPIQTSTAREVGFPEDLGGGRYLTDSTGVAVKSPRSQSALPSMGLASGIERDHIVPVGLGGVSNLQNLGYKPTTAEGRQAGKVAVEQEAISKYQRGEISLYEAILLTQTKQQQILGLTPTEKEKTVKGQLPSVIKEKINPIETLKGFFKKATPTAIIKEYAKALAPKEMAEVEAKARQAEQEKLGQQSMRFETGAGMSNVEKVLPGPRVSTLEAIKKGADVQPVKAGELPTVSPVRQAQEIVRKEDVPSEIPTALGRLAGVAQTGMGAIRGTSGALSLPISLAANLASKERLPVRDVIQATSDMIEKDMASGGTASTGEAAQMYLSFREIGKYGGKEPDAVDITVLALIGLGDAVGDPLLYAGAIKPALNKLKFHTQYKKVGEVALKAKPGVKITSPQKGIVNVSDDLKIIIDPKSKSIKLSGYAKRGATREVINQKAITGVVDDISRQTGSQLSTKVVGNDIIINTSVAPQAVVSPATKAVVLPKAQIKPQKPAGEVLPKKTNKVSPEVKPALKSAKLDTLNPTGSVFADYTPAKRATAELADNITTLDKTMKKPADEMITIYRGTGKGGDIVAGDFVTTNKQLAKDYAGTGVVVEKKVKLSDILDDVNEPLGEEYIYRPKTKPLKSVDDNLIQEAKKYKSAEEFIKAQGTRMTEVRDKSGLKLQDPYTAEYLPTNPDGTITLYHSTTKDGAKKIEQSGIFGSKTEGGDIYFTTNKKGYGGIGKDKDVVLAFNVNPKKVKFDDVYRGELHLKGNNTDIGGIKPVEIKTKSQLTEIWNKANKKTLPKPKKQPIKYVPVEKPVDLRKKITTESIVAKPSIPQRIKAETIKSGLEDAFGDIEYYNKVSVKSQADETAKLINEDYDRAIRIAMGQENAPGDLLPESVLIGVKNQAIKSGDTELLINLATAEGGVARESTILGQRIKMLDEGLEDDAFRNIKKVVSERRNNYQKKTGKSVDKAIKQEADKIKEAIKKTAPKKDEWLSFIQELTC